MPWSLGGGGLRFAMVSLLLEKATTSFHLVQAPLRRRMVCLPLDCQPSGKTMRSPGAWFPQTHAPGEGLTRGLDGSVPERLGELRHVRESERASERERERGVEEVTRGLDRSVPAETPSCVCVCVCVCKRESGTECKREREGCATFDHQNHIQHLTGGVFASLRRSRRRQYGSSLEGGLQHGRPIHEHEGRTLQERLGGSVKRNQPQVRFCGNN